jgi:putative NIF3 family GTP cyclohydrolase 1 type 2
MDVTGFINTALGRKIFNKTNIAEPQILGDGTAIFELKTPLQLTDVIIQVKHNLKLSTVNILPKNEQITKIAVHGGEGFNHHHVKDAIAEGVDLYLAGDLTHHLAEFVDWYDVSFIDINHFTEQEGMNALRELLSVKYPPIKFLYVEQPAWWHVK